MNNQDYYEEDEEEIKVEELMSTMPEQYWRKATAAKAEDNRNQSEGYRGIETR